ncbi:hypothetical protein [Pseudanabaena sp. FACHB-2040]|uniref:hypothetical protein n=1 Tax=Pseudanabaena sp. FACHB-2040 TaxID=2692859 RepID=UPI0016876828|nr:hypothetical protein [Pseudanabaena sp. FACHB-2040]MBD2257231.1 hypothetical protein [Pseudanabaena sp. FACHB-2040]
MQSANIPKLTVVSVVVAVSFFLALTLVEAIPEIPVDIDFKPFFIPMVFAALVPRAWGPLLAVGLGGMLGEFLRDLLEGYEIDDPIGAIGYLVGFVVGGYIVGNRPLNKARLAFAVLVSGFLHAVIEVTALLLFDQELLRVAIWSAIGNTINDGIILGAIPAVLLMPRLYGRVERYLGFAPRGIEYYRRKRRLPGFANAS